MKKQGFTLIEMLVVIAILAILMSITIPGAGLIMRKMKEAQARSESLAISSIISAYRNEYNRWPGWDSVNKNPTPSITDADWVEVMTMIRPPANANLRQYNPRLIQFWEADPKVVNADGAWVDPWGNPYQYLLDHNHDDLIDAPDGQTVRAKVIVWSWGANGVDDQYHKDEDDVGTWAKLPK